MQPHEQRVVDEKKELDKKIYDLSCFIKENPIFPNLQEEDRKLLIAQANSMSGYSEILKRRIDRF